MECTKDSQEWRVIAVDFESKWSFPNWLGAIDGKHVLINCPANGGSLYHNYKKLHSIVLVPVIDENYKFVMVDSDDYGRLCDSSVFTNPNIVTAINAILLDVPTPIWAVQ